MCSGSFFYKYLNVFISCSSCCCLLISKQLCIVHEKAWSVSSRERTSFFSRSAALPARRHPWIFFWVVSPIDRSCSTQLSSLWRSSLNTSVFSALWIKECKVINTTIVRSCNSENLRKFNSTCLQVDINHNVIGEMQCFKVYRAAGLQYRHNLPNKSKLLLTLTNGPWIIKVNTCRYYMFFY